MKNEQSEHDVPYLSQLEFTLGIIERYQASNIFLVRHARQLNVPNESVRENFELN